MAHRAGDRAADEDKRCMKKMTPWPAPVPAKLAYAIQLFKATLATKEARTKQTDDGGGAC